MAISPDQIPLPDSSDVTPKVERLTRQDFLEDVFADGYQAGEHVTIVGPTGTGKTTLAFQMLDQVAKSDLPVIVLAKKPRDTVIAGEIKNLGLKKTETWPPVWKRGWKQKSGGFMNKRRGWVFWPRHNLKDIRKNIRYLSKEFEKVITDCYRKGDRIVFVDDLVGVSKEYGLEPILTTVYMEGRSMGCGLWGAIQRPYHAPVIMYGAAEHLVIFKDPDKRSVDRFKEIGGVDPDIVQQIVWGLRKHEFLYIGRNMADDGVSPALAIVDSGNGTNEEY